MPWRYCKGPGRYKAQSSVPGEVREMLAALLYSPLPLRY